MPLRLAIAAALLAASACRPEQPAAPASAPQAPKDAVLHKATLSTWRKNTPVLTAKSDAVTWYRQESRFVAAEVVATLPSREGPVAVAAPRVDGKVTGEALDASGGVTVRSARGVAHSPTAHLENGPAGAIVSSDAGVVFEGKGQRLQARAFRFDTHAQQASFEGVETSTQGAP